MTATKKATNDSSIDVDVERPLPNINNEIITDSKMQINQQATNSVTVNVVTAGENISENNFLWKIVRYSLSPRVPIVED